MNVPAGHAFDDVTKTRWSLIQRTRASRPADARAALAELAVHYWYPVYAYVRRCGHAPEIAQDIVQSFFQHLGDVLATDRGLPHARFRDWLLERLNVFLAADWRVPAAAEPMLAAPALDDLERRNNADHLAGCSPEQAYQRGYALEVLARGFKALQAEARQTGHSDMYEVLEPYLARDPLPGQYEEMARRLGLRPLVLVLALKRLRQRFRELVRAELADTAASPDEMLAEQQVLFAALAQDG